MVARPGHGLGKLRGGRTTLAISAISAIFAIPRSTNVADF
jgi:hypothetical protein